MIYIQIFLYSDVRFISDATSFISGKNENEKKVICVCGYALRFAINIHCRYGDNRND